MIDIKEMIITVLIAVLFAVFVCSVLIYICAVIWPATGPTVVIEIIGG